MAVDRKLVTRTLRGIAGEYFVAAELSRRGYVASLTLRNTKGIDILVSNQDATKAAGIQVKTTLGTRARWILTKKAEISPESLAVNLFFVFVAIPEDGSLPSYHIVPRSIVAESVRRGHEEWLNTSPRFGQRFDSSLRQFVDVEGKYKDNWSALGLDTP